MSNSAEKEIIKKAYCLIQKLYSNLIIQHEKSNSKKDLILIKEVEIFELQNGKQIEELLK